MWDFLLGPQRLPHSAALVWWCWVIFFQCCRTPHSPREAGTSSVLKSAHCVEGLSLQFASHMHTLATHAHAALHFNSAAQTILQHCIILPNLHGETHNIYSYINKSWASLSLGILASLLPLSPFAKYAQCIDSWPCITVSKMIFFSKHAFADCIQRVKTTAPVLPYVSPNAYPYLITLIRKATRKKCTFVH